MASDLVIIGASVRAAAFSARRAGMQPWCADLFADTDLQLLGPVRRVRNFPHGLVQALADAPPAPLVYTGGLENYPALLTRIHRALWGNGPEVLRRVRSPETVCRILGDQGLPCPRVCVTRPETMAVPWLLKPRRGSGGLGIHPYAGQAFDPRTHYLQEQLDGTPVSGIFLGRSDGTADFLGTSLQLVAAPFRYAGSVGPLPVEPQTRSAWESLGQALTAHFGLRGLFGVDAILRDGTVWAVEVNPRYTASVEILELSLGVPFLALHRAVFTGQAMAPVTLTSPAVVWGKAVLYAKREIAFPASGPWTLASGEKPRCADIPEAGAVIQPGHPILTVFASASNVAECEEKLRQTAQDLDRVLGNQ